jgi:Thioesterase-like superfamily
MQVARLTVDLSRTVPTGPTEVRVSVQRDGRRLQVIDAELLVDGVVRARANSLRLRVQHGVILGPDVPRPWPDDLAGDPAGAGGASSPMGTGELWDAHEARWQDGTPGAGQVWLRPSCPVVEDEPLTPTVRAALVADLTMTAGGLLSQDYVAVNPDLTLLLGRPPEGEWIAIRSRVRLRAEGVGVSEGTLFDEHGWFAHTVKSVLIDRRRPRP